MNFFANLILVSLLVFQNQNYGLEKYRIKLIEYNYTFIPQAKCRDTLYGNIDHNNFLKIYLNNCKGNCDVECYNKDSVIVEKGSYINSLDLLKSYYYALDASQTSKTEIKVISYYQPLRNGVWYFYNDSGRLFLNKIYNNGILIDSLAAK